jgi:hypothetical protein
MPFELEADATRAATRVSASFGMTLPEFFVAEQEGSLPGREGLPKERLRPHHIHTGDCRSRRSDIASVAAPVEILEAFPAGLFPKAAPTSAQCRFRQDSF